MTLGKAFLIFGTGLVIFSVAISYHQSLEGIIGIIMAGWGAGELLQEGEKRLQRWERSRKKQRNQRR
jgi:hypothetical protein